MNNFQTKLLATAFNQMVDEDESLTRSHFHDIDMCHIGENYISDYTEVEPFFDQLDINDCPSDLYDFYEKLGMAKTIIFHDEFPGVNFNQPFEWPRKRPFHFIYNCGKSPLVFNQAAFFETIHNMAGINTYMIHSVPFFSMVESSMYCYSPSFFARLCGANQYEMVGSFIGTTTTERWSKLDIQFEYSGNYYNEKYSFNTWGNGEDKGYKRPAHIGVILRKVKNTEFVLPPYREEDVQEDN